MRRFVNADTLASLQIIMPESHPNPSNQGPGTTGAKESLSVFGLFQGLAKTSQGKAGLRKMFLRPSTDVTLIEARFDFISVFSRSDNQAALKQLSKNMSKIKNLRNVMSMLHKGVEGGTQHGNFKSGVWSSLLEFCYNAIEIEQGLREVAEAAQLPLCTRAGELLHRHDMQRIGKMIHDVVDLDLSQEQRRTVVNRGVDGALDRIKDVYDGMDELLAQVARDIARTIPAELNCQINVIFFPQLGFHIIIPLDETTMQPMWEGDNTWARMFTTKNMVYFKEETMRQMDSEISDLWADICDIEIEIVHGLAQRVLEDETFLVAASDICGELDCLFALAQGAIQYRLSRPRIVEDNIIEINGGRHLLQELVVPNYVPNDTCLEGGTGADRTTEDHNPAMLVLTGPNYSGKSVYQNQVATITYMAQIGSFVPANRARLGITDKLLTRITTTESVSRAQSAFMIDLQQVALALNSCTHRSLLIIDEFGKGTDTYDGVGLAAGVLQHLLSLGVNRPKAIVATHLHEIFELGLLEDEEALAHAHMEVHIEKGARVNSASGESAEEITYLYQLAPGRSMLSYGAQCAAMNNVPKTTVDRAAALAESIARGDDVVKMCSVLSTDEYHDLEVAELISRRFMAEDLDQRFLDEEEGIRALLEAVLDVSVSSAYETSMQDETTSSGGTE
jgi:DNA mismatch repair protein MSH5